MANTDDKSIIKKINSLKNLRDALKKIRHIKDGEGSSLEEISKSEGLEKTPNSLSTLGVNKINPGRVVYHIGQKNSPSQPHYQVSVNSQKIGKTPHISITQHQPDGSVIAKSPQLHSSMESAVKSISNHFKSGAW